MPIQAEQAALFITGAQLHQSPDAPVRGEGPTDKGGVGRIKCAER